ncbi:MAG: hypothetical protein OEY93_05530 [Anaerolineae bacterium]|nr:hypothetical protein [Anaerolineae bacterium]
MARKETWIQAYRQAPWRKQLQLIGLFSATLAMLTLIAGTYLNVAARTATIGREVQRQQRDIRLVEQRIVNLESLLAEQTSARVMAKRAEKLGYFTLNTEVAIYLVVPGYSGRKTAVLAPPDPKSFPMQTQLPAAYTQSLVDWLRQQVYLLGLQTGVQGNSQ